MINTVVPENKVEKAAPKSTKNEFLRQFVVVGRIQRITEMTDEELEKYNVIIAQLRLVEDPVEQCEPINEVMMRIASGNQRYITRRTVDAFIRNNPDFMASIGGEKTTPDTDNETK